MLTIRLPETEDYDSETRRIITRPSLVLEFEHSLFSLSKWEQVHKKPFLGPENPTDSELFSYFEMMCLTDLPGGFPHNRLGAHEQEQIVDYIREQRTATTIKNQNGPKSREIVTAEIIYYWMVSYRIPFETEHWHLSKLLTLIEVCAIKNQPKKKMSRSDAMSRQRALNAQRRAAAGNGG